MPNLENAAGKFKNFESFLQLKAKNKPGRVIARILVVNNGLAAVKCLISIRQWLLQNFGTNKTICFVCMVTPNELQAASQYVKMADEIVIVPAGKNSNNFANIDQILKAAVEKKVDAVYVGWGHASENPELSSRLENAGITFIGPSEHSMTACGDKIVSTIIAQSLHVPTVKWSGSDITVNECVTTLNFNSLRRKATITTVASGLSTIEKFSIGFPLMIKASEGGGGKGIRLCQKVEQFPKLFKEVSLEVPHSPIFLMKCVEGARHVEVQIIGDQFGNVMALSTRDCSIQRRCQKVIEEAPASIVPELTLQKMQNDAVNFAKFVNYHSAGTIEFLFLPSTNEYFFLELNPRLQVEHPCSEMICDLNIPAAQFQIACGLALDEIDDIARFIENHGKTNSHSIAARITCEDPKDRFLPSTGQVKSLSFSSTQHAWGYFSVSSGSTVHEFADSQIGHVFAKGRDRNEAVANLKNALMSLKIDATFPTQIEYLIDLLSLKTFQENSYNTQWLDHRIANKEQPKLNIPIDDIIAVSAAVIGSSKIGSAFQKYEKMLEDGKIVLPVELSRCVDVVLLVDNVKYKTKVLEESDSRYSIRLITSRGNQDTTVDFVKMGQSKNVTIAIHNNKSIEYVHKETEDFHMINLGGTCLTFDKNQNQDASVLISPYTGKFLEYKVSSGESLKVGETYAQIESMKMVFDVVVKIAEGRLIKVAKEGDMIHPGTILAKLEVDDNKLGEKNKSDVFDGTFESWNTNEKTALEKILMILDGRVFAKVSNLDVIANELYHSVEKWETIVTDILERFIEVEKNFNTDLDSFDDSVRNYMDQSSSLNEVVNAIYSNTCWPHKEELIFCILTKWRHRIIKEKPEFLISLLIKLFDLKYLKKSSALAADILFEIQEPSEFKHTSVSSTYHPMFPTTSRMVVSSNGMIIYQVDSNITKLAASRCIAICCLKLEKDSSSWKETMQKFTNRAVVAFQCISNMASQTPVVSNKIYMDIEMKSGDRVNAAKVEEAAKSVIRTLENRLKNGHVVEIDFSLNKNYQIRYTDEIGIFLKETSLTDENHLHRKPNKRDLKRTVARKNRTTYIYDFPMMFAKAAFDTWKEVPKMKREAFKNGNWKEFAEVSEIVFENGKVRLIDDMETLKKRSEEGLNDCAMVAWFIRIFISNQHPIEFVLIGNDITLHVGSFAMPEHELFEAASRFARERKIPRVNVSCNSGARIGVAKDVLDCLKVKLSANGTDFNYLYLDKKEKERIGNQVIFEEVGDELRLLAVKGKKGDFIGVENLMGSGSIGGETSRAYREIPTYCYVTGRSVGIGAYTARLARRIIQHEKSHLILTGFGTLNTLLGKKVYASNNRLGGVEIMTNNGIAHAVVASDFEGVEKIVKWLSYIPIQNEQFPFYKSLNTEVESMNVQVNETEMQQDVRKAIVGTPGKQGIFDTDSFDEICDQYAPSIVVGRAKLVGMPVGVVASQWRSFETKQLADEALESTVKTTTTRAGQVWYPESAFKTSQAISDFNKEGMPLVIISSLRGFSGGRKDMSDMVLTFGAHIIDELSQYNQPVIVYIPPGGELRGGAWAVIDSNVHRGFIHVVADVNSRGGILEPNAIVGIKVREPQMQKLLEINGIDKNNVTDCVQKSFKKAATEFADMHDRWQRMLSVGAIEHVVSLKNTRRLFWKILRNQMVLLELAKKYSKSPCYPQPSNSEALNWVLHKLDAAAGMVPRDPEDDDVRLDQLFKNISLYYENNFEKDLRAAIKESAERYKLATETWKM